MRRAGGLIVWTLFVAVLTVHAEDRHGCRYRRTYETGCENDIRYQANFNPTEPVCLNEIMTFLVPQTWIDQGARYQEVIVYRHPEICPPVYIDHNVPAGTPQYGWRIWCEGKVVAQGAGPEASCKAVTNKVYTCEFVTSLDRKCAPTPSTSWVSRSAMKLDVWGIWTNVFLGTNLQLRAEGKPPYVWKSRDAGIASVDQEGLVTGVKTGRTTIMVWDANQCYRELLVKVLDMDLMPDVNRDRVIGEEDRGRVTPDKPFRFWINDDRDFGDISDDTSDIPGAGSGANHRGGQVNGRSDLLDFFPLWLDIRQVVNEMYPGDGVRLVLRQGGDAVKAVYTDLIRGKAGQFLVADNDFCGPGFNQPAHGADKFTLASGGVDLPEALLGRIRANPDKGVLMVEGAGKTEAPISLEAWKGGTLLCRKDLPIRIDGVEKMFWGVNIRNGEQITPPQNELPEVEGFGKNLVFVHGYNVSEQGARGWNSELYKRLFWSGSKARFYGVTWFGNDGQKTLPIVGEVTQDYYGNVIHALNDATLLRDVINNIGPGSVILAAHSLGNMIASEAIRIGARVEKYFAFNAAVASEAYETGLYNTNMVHKAWGLPGQGGFDARLHAANWHELFKGNPQDGRNLLTWSGHFRAVVPRMFNFYSSGEEVLDVHPHANEPDILGDIVMNWGQFAWAMQEKLKGSSGLLSAGESLCGGWKFDGAYARGVINPESGTIVVATTPAQATPGAVTDAMLKRYPFARRGVGVVELLYNTEDGGSFASGNLKIFLASSIPAESLPAGKNGISLVEELGGKNYNLNSYVNNHWPASRSTMRNRWLHSDIVNVSYSIINKLFDDISSITAVRF